MSRFCKELNKTFSTKELMFKELLANEQIIIDAKKSEIYKSIDKGVQIVTNQTSIQKALESNTDKSIKFDDAYYYFVVNSSNILDSHSDVHVDGNWNKSVKDQQGKVYLVFDHSLKRNDIIAMRKDIEMFTAKIPFSLLGKSYDGETYSLIYKIAKDKIVNKDAKEWLEQGHELEASVRMQYIKIETAFDTDDKDYTKQKANFDEYYPLIANKEEFEEIEYFWVIKEAKNVFESSLVLFASNSATGLINNKQAEQSLETKEPSNDTQTEKKSYYSHLLN